MQKPTESFLAFLEYSFPNGASIHEPFLDESDAEAVKTCVESGWVSSVGEEICVFEESIQTFSGANNAVAVVNGTAALQMCYVASGVERGDEVLCPSLTFVATLNALLYVGAVPHLVDSEEETMGVDPIKLRYYLERKAVYKAGKSINKETGRQIKALVVTHIFGHPCKLDELKLVCDDFGLFLIEDAAEALGSYYNGKHVGKIGVCSALSFNGNKIITTGGGGMVLSEDNSIANRVKHLSKTAKKNHPFEFFHDELGYNYRMPNLNASLGNSQLSKLDDILNFKRNLANHYKSFFQDIPGVEFFSEPTGCKSNYWLNAIRFSNFDDRNKLMSKAKKNNIHLRPLWTPMHLLPYTKSFPRDDLSIATSLYETVVNIPSSYKCMDLKYD
jgi:perosamine synthetase